jgi:hypothetical protein
MTSLARFGALAATVGTAAAGSAAWLTLSQGPQNAAGGTPAAGPGQDKMVVCIAQDSSLRAVAGSACPAGLTLVPLASAGPGDSDAAPKSRQLDLEITDMERRVAQLKRSPLFTVVDKNDQPIFAVTGDQVIVYQPTPGLVGPGRPKEKTYSQPAEAVSISFTGDKGEFTARSDDRTLEASLGSKAGKLGFWVSELSISRLEVGEGESGTYALRVRNPGGGLIAGIGETRAGTGALIVGDATGKPRVMMTVADGKGSLDVLNAGGAKVATLTEGATAGGLFTINDSKGTTMAKMGVNQDSYGVVLAGPRAGFPLVPRSGLPGSYFLGCAAGPACQP